MDAPLEALWRRLAPPGVCISGGFETAPPAPTAVERASLGPAGERRLRQFAAGRLHARQALQALGWPLAGLQLPRGADRSPQWPAGVAGSIAHADSPQGLYAVAAVARSGQWAALGIDVEPGEGIEAAVWPTFACAGELDALRRLPPSEARRHALALWCAKEAAVKLHRAPLDPRAIEVAFDGDGFVARRAGSASACCSGSWAREAGWTLALAWRPATIGR